jgi:hypothetical protein
MREARGVWIFTNFGERCADIRVFAAARRARDRTFREHPRELARVRRCAQPAATQHFAWSHLTAKT